VSIRPTRRTALRAGLATALAMPWVTSRAQSAGTINVVLNQGLLARLWIDELHPVFERETGARINVQQSVMANMLAMLRTQRDNPPDLMQFSEAGVFQAARDGLLRQHNPANIPNWATLRPQFRLADNYSAGVIDAVHTLLLQHASAAHRAGELGDDVGKRAAPPHRHPSDRLEQRRAHGDDRGADRHRPAVRARAIRPRCRDAPPGSPAGEWCGRLHRRAAGHPDAAIPPTSASSSCRSVPPAPRAGARSGWRRWSRGTP
jgi:hypothetical protein